MKNQIKVRVTKISDEAFNDNHPRGINTGYVKEGFMREEPEVGKEFWVETLSTWFHTSIVTEIIDEQTFKTLHSTYKWEKL